MTAVAWTYPSVRRNCPSFHHARVKTLPWPRLWTSSVGICPAAASHKTGTAQARPGLSNIAYLQTCPPSRYCCLQLAGSSKDQLICGVRSKSMSLPFLRGHSVLRVPRRLDCSLHESPAAVPRWIASVYTGTILHRWGALLASPL